MLSHPTPKIKIENQNRKLNKVEIQNKTMNYEIKQLWKEIENNASIKLKDWELLKEFIWKLNLRIEELEKSRNNWKMKFEELKEEIKKIKLENGKNNL